MVEESWGLEHRQIWGLEEKGNRRGAEASDGHRWRRVLARRLSSRIPNAKSQLRHGGIREEGLEKFSQGSCAPTAAFAVLG